MDLAILIPVVRALRAQLVGAALEDVRQDGWSFRFVFVGSEERPRSMVVSIDPVRPWIGRSRVRATGLPGTGAVALRRELKGLRLRDLTLAEGDRTVTSIFADGHQLVVHLGPHRANLVAVGPDRTVRAAARFPRSAGGSLAIGRPYSPPSAPRCPDPRGLLASDIDRRIERSREDGLDLAAVLRTAFFGVSAETAGLVLDEVRSTGRSPGVVLESRLALLANGRLEPVVLADADPATARPQVLRLLPWDPEALPAGLGPFRGPDAAATVGLYHDAVERIERMRERAATIRSLVAGEERRIVSAVERARVDLEAFADPEVHRIRGEAILAGLSRAVRVDDTVRVPDPYAPEGRELVIPVRPGVTLAAHANECFRLHSRALRGAAQAQARIRSLEARLERLRAVPVLGPDDPDRLDRLEKTLVDLRVVIEPSRRPGGSVRRVPPRALGVRAFVGPGGATVLAGRSGPGNDRLTFRLATADDIWLHALGVSGTHVILRNPPGRRVPDRDALLFAAGIAAWFSDARGSAAVDVQWTRRKFVRRRRGAPAGTVLLKKFEVLRIRPAAPPEP